MLMVVGWVIFQLNYDEHCGLVIGYYMLLPISCRVIVVEPQLIFPLEVPLGAVPQISGLRLSLRRAILHVLDAGANGAGLPRAPEGSR